MQPALLAPLLVALHAQAGPVAPSQTGGLRQTVLLRWRADEKERTPLSELAIASAIPDAVESDVDVWGIRPENASAVVMLRAEHIRYLRHNNNARLEILKTLLQDVDRVISDQARDRRRRHWTLEQADNKRRPGQLPDFFDDYRVRVMLNTTACKVATAPGILIPNVCCGRAGLGICLRLLGVACT